MRSSAALAQRSEGLKSIELFTGAGGLSLATHYSGFQHQGLFEWNADACGTLALNAEMGGAQGLQLWADRINRGDVRDVSFENYSDLDLVAGGPPCQPFSLGGKHRGMEDQRDMIPQFIRAVREAKPRAFIMENVRGLARKSFASYLHVTVLQLTYPEIERRDGEEWASHYTRLQQHHTSTSRSEGLMYNVVLDVLNSADYGVPQCRERLFIVGFRSDIDANWSFPEPTHSLDRLLFDQWVSGEYWDRVNVRPPASPLRRAPQRVAALSKTTPPPSRPWKTLREAIATLPDPRSDQLSASGLYNHRYQPGARPYPGHTGSPMDAPSKTLKAGAHGVPGGENMIDFGDGTYRYFTIREAARLQTFPDTWRFHGAWSEAMRQLGNAVPVEMANAVAHKVASTLLLKA